GFAPAASGRSARRRSAKQVRATRRSPLLSKWPIRTKLFACFGLLLVIVALLSFGGIRGLYSYRSLVRSLGRRVPELPLANQFSHDISELRIALNESRTSRELELTGH